MKTEQASVDAAGESSLQRSRSAVSSNTRYLDQKVDYGEVYPTFNYGLDTFIDPHAYDVDARVLSAGRPRTTIVNSDNHAQIDFQTGPLSHKVLVGIDYTLFEQDRREGLFLLSSTIPAASSR